MHEATYNFKSHRRDSFPHADRPTWIFIRYLGGDPTTNSFPSAPESHITRQQKTGLLSIPIGPNRTSEDGRFAKCASRRCPRN
ncbi:hypothetical protein CEXT_499891 [Caerostris extrusa]|uniref:Ycf15 n=1 Tax=Caerostris extrusa TaxID=172846 RepID=A0AAV4U2N7_CAEEX|nr:hypothetical protein CEXT_499891 [Caerostris extrusa]